MGGKKEFERNKTWKERSLGFSRIPANLTRRTALRAREAWKEVSNEDSNYESGRYGKPKMGEGGEGKEGCDQGQGIQS